MKMKVSDMALIGMMAAVICVIAPFSIPIQPVPLSLATFAVLLTSGLIGAKKGSLSVLIYLLLGAIGVPVFALWTGGFGIVAGPTGGYIIGYVFAALATGLVVDRAPNKFVLYPIGMAIGLILCYAVGTIWLAHKMSLNFGAALMAGVVPFIPGDVIKMILASLLAYTLRQRLAKKVSH